MDIAALNATFSAFYDRLLLDSAFRRRAYMSVKCCTVCGRTDREFAEKADGACRMCVVASL